MKATTIKRQISHSFIYVILLLQSFLIILPIFIMVNSSLKPSREIFRNPFKLPDPITFKNFVKLFVTQNYGLYLMNSVIVSLSAIIIILIVSSLVSFALAKYTFKANKYFHMFFLMGLMLPIRLGTINLIQMFIKLNLFNTPFALIAVYSAMGIPAGVLIFTGFIRDIPNELMDAARVDGYTDTMIFLKIIVPLLSPGIVVVAVYNLMPIWNDFWFPLILVNKPEFMTIPLATAQLFGKHETDFGLLYAILTVAAIPPMVLFVGLSRYFIAGLTAGAIKG